jgi:FkbM family methyltransferase
MARGRRLRVLLIACRFEVQRHLFSREFIATQPRGAKLICPPWTGSSRFPLCLGIVDVEEQTFLLDTLRPGDVAVDVGAFLGIYTVLMAACGATVYAFEPTERVREVLTRSIRANGFTRSVSVSSIALSDFTGRASFTTEFDSGNRLVGGDAAGGSVTSEVAVDTLDHWADLNDLTGLFVVKIDAEGADERVLMGAAAVLERFDPVVIVEYWDGADPLRSLLRSHGYEARRYIPEERRLVARPDAAAPDGNLIACSAERLQDVQRRLASIEEY